MSGKAVLICRPNSHPFPERTLSLDQPVKIGRSVARARPASNNAIFDCKVLSRNHALIWYNNGKFYLQDTKSSNGTFVNNHRLSKSGEESLPREVCSGDIVQFGVDVLENTRKVTHGCIVANLKLYLPDGKEARASLSTSVISSSTIPMENLYELYQYLQEAVQREQLLESKLVSLQEMLHTIRDSAEQGWRALIAEDRLLTRVDALESQLAIFNKNIGEDKLKDELRVLHEEKNCYQNTAKEFLKKVLDEKVEAVRKYDDVKRSLLTMEAQYSSLSETLATSNIHIQELAHKLNMQMSRTDVAEMKIQDMEVDHREKVTRLQIHNQELEKALQYQKEEVGMLGGHLVIDVRAPGGPLPFPSRSSLINENCSEEIQKAFNETNGEEVLMNTAHILELQQLYESSNTHIDDIHLHSQILNSDKTIISDIGVSPQCVTKNQLLLDEGEKELFMSSEVYPVPNDEISEEIKASCEQLSKSLDINVPLSLLEKPSADYEVDVTHHLTPMNKFNEEFVMDKAPADEFENQLNRLNQCNEEQSILRKHLGDGDITDTLKLLSSDLEFRHQQQEQLFDNKLREELQKLNQDYLNSKHMLTLFQSEIITLKDDCEKLDVENRRLRIELEQCYHHDELNNSDHNDELTRKITNLEENLVLVSQKYMECNEERSQLRHQLNELQLDYQAISHQPYFNLFFALPCIVLVFAVTFLFYPTLSKLMGTADTPDAGTTP